MTDTFAEDTVEKEDSTLRPDIVVLGLGNLLLRDEGVGVHALRRFEGLCPPGVLALDVGTAVWRVESFLESAELIIAFDALQSGGPPGSIYAAAPPLLSETARHSLHEYGLLEMLSLRPNHSQVLILGIEPEAIGFGLELTASVEAALPTVIATTLEVIALWRLSPGDQNSRAQFVTTWLQEHARPSTPSANTHAALAR